MQIVLPFETLPKGLPFGKKITYCLVDISGIQSYIFSAMDRHTTPEVIRSRSGFVEQLALTLGDRLRAFFPGKLLLDSPVGGNLLCVFHPSVDKAALQVQLESLQRAVFASTQGKLTFFFAFCDAKCIPENRFRPEKMVHAGTHLAQLLEQEKFRPLNLLKTDMQQEKDTGLTPPISPSADPEMKADQAVVKLDLDNLGDFFRNITAFDRRNRISTSLNRSIKTCLEADSRITPVFAGGDDIFFLCPLTEFLPVVASFYTQLRQTLAADPELAEYERKHFGISAGISVGLKNNRVCLLSYWEESEQALHLAKTRDGKNCVYLQLPMAQPHLRWEDLLDLAAIYSRPQVRERLFSQHRFQGANLAHIGELTQQLCETKLLTKKELNRLNEIRLRSL